MRNTVSHVVSFVTPTTASQSFICILFDIETTQSANRIHEHHHQTSSSRSSTFPSPSPHAFLSSLLEHAHAPRTPLFPLRASSVSFLPDPPAFYQTLLDAIARSHDRITLSALYLGHGPMEQALVQHILAACHKKPNLRVQILLDHSRGTRGHRQGTSSLTTLAPLLSLTRTRPSSTSLQPQAHVALLRMPQLSGPWARRFIPSPLNEVLAVSHVKALAFDDEEILLTGANLSHDYFSRRQDRYVHVRGPWPNFSGADGGDGRLASLPLFYHGLVETLMPFGLSPAQALAPASQGVVRDFGALKVALGGLLGGETCVSPPSLPPSLPPSRLEDKDVCWALPTLQCAPLGIYHDERLLHAFLSPSLPPSLPASHLTVATAYLNPPSSFLHALRAWQEGGGQGGREGGGEGGQRRLSIIAPSANSHGFAGAKGLKSFIPLAYTLHERRVRDHFHPALSPALPPALPPAFPLSLYRYSRPGWTFHGKGLWLLEEEGGRAGGRAGGREGSGLP